MAHYPLKKKLGDVDFIYLCCSWLLYHLNIFIRICKSMLFWWCCFVCWTTSTSLSGYAKVCYSGDVVLVSVSPQHMYQGMWKYAMIGLLKIYWSKLSDKKFPIVFVSFSGGTCVWCIGPLLVILNPSHNVDFGDRHECVLKIYLNKPLETHDQMVGISCCSMVTPRFSVVLVVLYGDVVNPIFCITLIIFVKVLPRYLCDGLNFTPTVLIK